MGNVYNAKNQRVYVYCNRLAIIVIIYWGGIVAVPLYRPNQG